MGVWRSPVRLFRHRGALRASERYTASVEDKETITILTALLANKTLSVTETEAIRDAIGILSWTKLVEGMKDGKKRRRDAQLRDDASEPFL